MGYCWLMQLHVDYDKFKRFHVSIGYATTIDILEAWERIISVECDCRFEEAQARSKARWQAPSAADDMNIATGHTE